MKSGKLGKYVSMAYYFMTIAGVKPGNVTEITVNRRAVTRFGQCRTNTATGTSVVEVSDLLLQDGCEVKLLDTLIHELCHSAAPKDHHGEKWQSMVNAVDAVLPPGFFADSNRLSNYDSMPSDVVEAWERKHGRRRCGCPECGTTAYISKKNADQYQGKSLVCKKCGYNGLLDIAI